MSRTDYLFKELRILKASELLIHLALLARIFSLQLRTLAYHDNYAFIDTVLHSS